MVAEYSVTGLKRAYFRRENGMQRPWEAEQVHEPRQSARQNSTAAAVGKQQVLVARRRER